MGDSGYYAVLPRMVRLLAILAAIVLPFGGVYVSSFPSGADVWVDGSYIGRTPVLIDGLRAGKHALTITKTGWRVQEVDQQVTAGVVSTATIQLDPAKSLHGSGSIALHGLEKSARVSLDGSPWAPWQSEYSVSAGTHHLSVRDSSVRFERLILVYPDQVTHVLLQAPSADAHSAVVAPLQDYLPQNAAKIAEGRLVIHWGGHTVVGHVGDARFLVDGHDVVYDAPAGFVRGRLYLPLDLILTITGKSK
jgi:PEGA domain